MRFMKLDGMIRKLDRARKGKWAKLVAGTPKREPSCPLCVEECGSECPIGFIGGEGCEGTPWRDWREAAKQACDDTCKHYAFLTCPSSGCPLHASRPEAKRHARREARMLAAIQKGLEVMQRALAKIK